MHKLRHRHKISRLLSRLFQKKHLPVDLHGHKNYNIRLLFNTNIFVVVFIIITVVELTTFIEYHNIIVSISTNHRPENVQTQFEKR